jgi:NifU-like protein
MWDYTEKVRDHFLNPRNVGIIEDADAEGEAGSLACGDKLKLTLKLDDKERIVDAKFQTFGCASAIASSSALTEMLKGLTVEEAAKITNKDIADYLGGLPEEKMHCSVMGREALENAIARYRGETTERKAELEGEIVCRCFGVTDEKLKRAVRENDLKSVEEVTHYTKAGGGCEQCHPAIENIIKEVQSEKSMAEMRKTAKKLTNVQKINLIQKTLEEDIRPALAADGGDIDLIDVEGDKVMVSFRGKCVDCPMAGITLKDYIQVKLREHVTEELVVVEVQ